MINLLSPATKHEIAAARSNTLLARYNLLLVLAAVFMLIAIGVVYIFFQLAKTQAQTSITQNNSKAASFASTKQQADAFRSNLSSAKQILSATTNYPQMLIDISHVLPAGVVLNSLVLDSTTFGKPTTLNANATSYATALLLKNSLQASPLFSNVSLESVSNTGNGKYPVSVTLNVVINKGPTS